MKKQNLLTKLKRTLLIVGILTLSLGASGCSKASDTVETSIAIETTAETKDFSMDLETIATTAIDIDNETVSVGITETNADKTYSGITSDGEAIAQVTGINLTSGYNWTESEAMYLEAMTNAWIADVSLQRDFLDERLADKLSYPSLSDTDRKEAADWIEKTNPHAKPAPKETVATSKPKENKPASKPKESQPAPKETQAAKPQETQSNNGSGLSEAEIDKRVQEEMAAEDAINSGKMFEEETISGATVDIDAMNDMAGKLQGN